MKAKVVGTWSFAGDCLKMVVVNNGENEGQGSCGAVFAWWLVAVEGGERDIEMVVGGRLHMSEDCLKSLVVSG